MDHVEDLTILMGWECEMVILLIPSTRNAAVIGMRKKPFFQEEPSDATEARVMGLVAAEGGAEGWVENLMLLMRKTQKNH